MCQAVFKVQRTVNVISYNQGQGPEGELFPGLLLRRHHKEELETWGETLLTDFF